MSLKERITDIFVFLFVVVVIVGLPAWVIYHHHGAFKIGAMLDMQTAKVGDVVYSGMGYYHEIERHSLTYTTGLRPREKHAAYWHGTNPDRLITKVSEVWYAYPMDNHLVLMVVKPKSTPFVWADRNIESDVSKFIVRPITQDQQAWLEKTNNQHPHRELDIAPLAIEKIIRPRTAVIFWTIGLVLWALLITPKLSTLLHKLIEKPRLKAHWPRLHHWATRNNASYLKGALFSTLLLGVIILMQTI
ncbi:hypothetical protein [Thiomicrospira microaerophila]|uniref:hypothetical protein n=1 Tax=Thiomicrospira microaerophila TaxID=406020 RepID=UPI0005C8A831|nr:hypothetical protein [Thiomicrospira microaerophila]